MSPRNETIGFALVAALPVEWLLFTPTLVHVGLWFQYGLLGFIILAAWRSPQFVEAVKPVAGSVLAVKVIFFAMLVTWWGLHGHIQVFIFAESIAGLIMLGLVARSFRKLKSAGSIAP